MRTVLGIDVGTTSVKAILVSSDGKIVDEVNAGHDLISEKSGWAEENAYDWWNNSVKVVSELKRRNPDLFDKVEWLGGPVGLRCGCSQRAAVKSSSSSYPDKETRSQAL